MPPCWRTEQAVEILRLLGKHQHNRRFHAVTDSFYGGQTVLCELPTNCDLTSRLVKDGPHYDAPPARKVRATGRPRVRGHPIANHDTRPSSDPNRFGPLSAWQSTGFKDQRGRIVTEVGHLGVGRLGGIAVSNVSVDAHHASR